MTGLASGLEGAGAAPARGLEAKATAFEHRLTTVCSLVALLLEDTDPARHAEALAVVAKAAWPIAVFDGETLMPRLTSEAWQDLHARSGSSSVLPRHELEGVFRSGVTRHVVELELADHGTRLTATLQPVRRLGVIIGVIAVCAELTDELVASSSFETERTKLLEVERAARVEAERANRLKDQFLAAVSHELRTPLTTMMLWEKVLRGAAADLQLRDRALDAIHQSAMAQSRLVGDLLDVSRAISGKLFIDLRPVDLSQLLRTAVEGVGRVARDKQVSIVPDFEVALGDVHGDANRLLQVFDNILSNAVKFTAAGGQVSVMARRENGTIVVAIGDTGRGIAPEFLPRLFEPFSQTDDALTRSEGGLGLGLAIAHQLVGLHHGSLVASSAGLGRGATFTITLPLTTQSIASPPHTGVAVEGPGLQGAKVLVIDDDARVRDALALLLGRSGAVIETADSAATARNLLRRFPADVLLCDIAMPGEDGYSFVTRLHNSEAAIGRKTPAIALTAHATAADGRRALAAGFDLHLAKPIDLDVLVTSIRDLVKSSSALRGRRP